MPHRKGCRCRKCMMSRTYERSESKIINRIARDSRLLAKMQRREVRKMPRKARRSHKRRY